jgi:hypothetical protein
MAANASVTAFEPQAAWLCVSRAQQEGRSSFAGSVKAVSDDAVGLNEGSAAPRWLGTNDGVGRQTLSKLQGSQGDPCDALCTLIVEL